MAKLNKSFLIGRLTRDPELKYTPSGVPVCGFTLAVDRSYKGQDGKEITDFIDCVAWRQQAEFMSQYLAKGRLVLVEGELNVRQWQDQQGQNRRSTEITAINVSPMDSRPQQQGNQPGGTQQGYNQPGPGNTPQQPRQDPYQQRPPQQAQGTTQGPGNYQAQPGGGPGQQPQQGAPADYAPFADFQDPFANE